MSARGPARCASSSLVRRSVIRNAARSAAQNRVLLPNLTRLSSPRLTGRIEGRPPDTDQVECFADRVCGLHKTERGGGRSVMDASGHRAEGRVLFLVVFAKTSHDRSVPLVWARKNGPSPRYAAAPALLRQFIQIRR